MLRILLVDKNSSSRNALRKLIVMAGADCIDGTEQTISQAALSGFDAAVVVNSTSPAACNIPVLQCFTSNPGTDAIARVIRQGAAEVLVMPFSAQHLMFKLQQLGLQNSRLAA
jgi:DNA-binding NtrC family response regulator